MEVRRVGRSSTSGRSEVSAISVTLERDKLATNAKISCHGKLHHEQQQQQHHPKNRSMKMFNKVQVVYYLTRNGQLEHPHFIEVSHLVTQPLRLKDVIDRLMVLRGKAMPCQYSWSCKRSYKNGYVWNDMTENDVVYASEGSEYVLKGSEIIPERDFSEIRLDELQIKRRQQQKGDHTKTTGLTNKSISTHQGQNYSQVVARHPEQNDNNEDDEEEKGSCNSSNAPYPNPTMEMEQEESYSLPSTSSTNSDKQPPPPPQPPSIPPTQSAKTNRIIEEDGNPTVSTSLTRNSTVLLHLIACGGGAIGGPQVKDKGKGSSSNRNFNFSMKNSFIPCLKQQLSTRGLSTNSNNVIPLRVKGVGAEEDERHNNDHNQVVNKEEYDEDMMMVRFMSENPRFGNLQSEDKEYFSGTIVEAMAHHQHTGSSGSASGHPYLHPQTPVFTKSSSYNEQRSSKAGLAAAPTTQQHEDDEKEDTKFKGIFRLCIPQKRSQLSTSTKRT